MGIVLAVGITAPAGAADSDVRSTVKRESARVTRQANALSKDLALLTSRGGNVGRIRRELRVARTALRKARIAIIGEDPSSSRGSEGKKLVLAGLRDLKGAYVQIDRSLAAVEDGRNAEAARRYSRAARLSVRATDRVDRGRRLLAPRP